MTPWTLKVEGPAAWCGSDLAATALRPIRCAYFDTSCDPATAWTRVAAIPVFATSVLAFGVGLALAPWLGARRLTIRSPADAAASFAQGPRP